MTESALKVTKNPLGSNEMNLPGIMHMKVDLLDGVSNVRPRKSQILKSSHKAAVCCRISNSRTGIIRDFGTGVDRSRARIASAHAMAIQNFQSVLSL